MNYSVKVVREGSNLVRKFLVLDVSNDEEAKNQTLTRMKELDIKTDNITLTAEVYSKKVVPIF